MVVGLGQVQALRKIVEQHLQTEEDTGRVLSSEQDLLTKLGMAQRHHCLQHQQLVRPQRSAVRIREVCFEMGCVVGKSLYDCSRTSVGFLVLSSVTSDAA